jgi:hypothetical protein
MGRMKPILTGSWASAPPAEQAPTTSATHTVLISLMNMVASSGSKRFQLLYGFALETTAIRSYQIAPAQGQTKSA